VKGFCWSKVYCLHAFADCNWHIQITEKMLRLPVNVLTYTISLKSVP